MRRFVLCSYFRESSIYFHGIQVTTDEQRTSFSSELTAMEDWLYIEGEDEPAKEFRKRLKSLKETGDELEVRAKEATERPTAIATARAYVELIRKAINSWPESKPFLNQTDIDDLSSKVLHSLM